MKLSDRHKDFLIFVSLGVLLGAFLDMTCTQVVLP